MSSEQVRMTYELARTIAGGAYRFAPSQAIVRQARELERQRVVEEQDRLFRRALACSLLDLYDIVEQRIADEALADLDGARGPLGLWADQPGSPLIGWVGDVDPFHRREDWLADVRATGETEEHDNRPRRRRRRLPDIPDYGAHDWPRWLGRSIPGGHSGEGTPRRDRHVEPGFAGRALPPGLREVGTPVLASALSVAAPLAGGMLGPLNNFVSWADALDSANQAHEQEGRLLGIRIGFFGLQILTVDKLRAGTIRPQTLKDLGLSNDILRNAYNEKIAGSIPVGPEVSREAVDSGIALIARFANELLEGVSRSLADGQNDLAPDQQLRVKRLSLDILLERIRETLDL